MILRIVIPDRGVGRNTVARLKFLNISFTQPEQRRGINLRVAADVVTEFRINLAAVLVEHLLRRIILERTLIAPVVLLAWQERPALQNKDTLAAGGQTI